MPTKPKSDSQGPADQKQSESDTKGYPEENPGAQSPTAGVNAKQEKIAKDVGKSSKRKST